MGRKKNYQAGILRPLFRPRRYEMGGFFVLRAEIVEDGRCSSFFGAIISKNPRPIFAEPPPSSNCRFQNPDIQRAGRVGAHGGAAGGGRAEQFAQETSVPRTPQGIEETSPERLSRSTTNKILCKASAGTKSAVDKRFVSGL